MIPWIWRVAPYRVPFIRPIATARGPWIEREGFWVTLQDDQGHLGVGEVAPLPDWGTETLAQAASALNHLKVTRADALEEISQALEVAGLSRELTPAAYAGCETALLDVLAQRQSLPLCAYLNPQHSRSVALNALIVADSPEEAAEEALMKVQAGYKTIKLKVGSQARQADVARVQAVREAVGTQVSLRLDANGAWERLEALDAIQAFAPFCPEYIEQPVAAADLKALDWICQQGGAPVAADEAIRTPQDAWALLNMNVGTLILKPLALGGLLVAGEVARQAHAAGKKVVLTSVLDRGVGTLACLHLAAALGEIVAPCGLATVGLFAGPAAIGPDSLVEGAWHPSAAPGLGLDAATQKALLP